MSHVVIVGDARRLPLADESAHCCVTSPPYLGLRDYGVAGQIGLEATPAEFVAEMVAVMREVRRVLRPDGTLWLNLGDSYANDTKWGGRSSDKNRNVISGGYQGQRARRATGLKPKDLMGMPWRVALALQDDGWFLRSDIVWSKGNAMPESVRDRPSRSHEFVFLLSKRPRYYYDSIGVREKAVCRHGSGNGFKRPCRLTHLAPDGTPRGNDEQWRPTEHRACRSVWSINTQPYREAHFAVMPPALADRCIRAGTSEHGVCPACGSPWRRIVERSRVATRPGTSTKVAGLESDAVGNRDPLRHVSTTRTLGWEPTCRCGAGDPVPAVVLDPFCGAGTSGVAAVGLGRSFVGVELNPEYAAMADRRISRPHAPAKPKATGAKRLPLFTRGGGS
jgi:DNA modification methylase